MVVPWRILISKADCALAGQWYFVSIAFKRFEDDNYHYIQSATNISLSELPSSSAVLRRATGTGMVSMCKRGVSLSFISGRRLVTKEATSVEESSPRRLLACHYSSKVRVCLYSRGHSRLEKLGHVFCFVIVLV